MNRSQTNKKYVTSFKRTRRRGRSRKRREKHSSSLFLRRLWLIGGGGFALVGIVLLFWFLFGRRDNGTLALQPALPQDPFIQVYFNHSQSAAYTDPYRHQQRLGHDLEQLIVDAIASAQVSVDVAVQELQLPRIAHALQEKHQRGVPVRVVLENQYSTSWSEYTAQEIQSLDERSQGDYVEFRQFVDLDGDRHISDDELHARDALTILESAGVPVIDDTADGSKGSGLMHHKFVIIDKELVLLGSLNFTMSGVHGDWGSATSLGNANHLLSISSPEVAAAFTEEFELLWGDGPGGEEDSQFGLQKVYRRPQQITLGSTSHLTVQFSPTSPSRNTWEDSTNGLIGRTLRASQHTADLALFVFSAQQLSHILQHQQQQGVTIRALIDAGFAYRNYSEALDLMGVALPDDHCRYGDDNQPWTQPLTTVGVPQLADGDVLHHKFSVIDRRVIITGSQNWSQAANTSNDETVLVIENPTVAAHFQQEFEQLYATAQLGVPSWLQDRIKSQQSRCSP